MRVLGTYSTVEGETACFLKSMAGHAAGKPSTRTIRFPAENPILSALVGSSTQPPLSCASHPNGSFAIVDGEIYQTDEALHDSDHVGPRNEAAALLAIYRSGGIEAIGRIDGAMALTIWDAPESRLLVFRDRWGLASCFFSETRHGIVWSSDLESLLLAGVPREVDRGALDFFIGNGFVPAPMTFLQGVRRIPPAHLLICDAGGHRLERYWRPTGEPPLLLNEEETTAHLDEFLQRAVRRRWPSDQQAGVLLSSGVDSKLLLAILKRRLGISADSFTFRYTDYEGMYNESEEALRTAREFECNHHEVLFRPSDIPENLEWMVRSYGEPLTFGLHSCMLRQIEKRGVSTLLSGAGPDGWYPSEVTEKGLRFARLPQVLQNMVPPVARLLRRLNCAYLPVFLWRLYQAAGWRADELELILACASTSLPSSLQGDLLPDEWRYSIYSDPGWVSKCRREVRSVLTASLADFPGEQARDKATFLHMQLFGAETTNYWNYSWSRACGLSIRSPYFDNDLVDFALRLPRNGKGQKPEVRRLAAQMMPHDMAYVPKIYQSAPIGHWFRGPLKEFLCDQLNSSRLQQGGLFDADVVAQRIKVHLSGQRDNSWILWSIISVLVWQDLVLDRPPTSTVRE